MLEREEISPKPTESKDSAAERFEVVRCVGTTGGEKVQTNKQLRTLLALLRIQALLEELGKRLHVYCSHTEDGV